MSININIKSVDNKIKWNSVKNGDFLFLEGIPEHPIPSGLYRTFVLNPKAANESFFIMPMFEGEFPENMFPYLITDTVAYPKILNTITKISIDVEIA